MKHGMDGDAAAAMTTLTNVIAGATAAIERLCDAIEAANEQRDTMMNGPRG